MRLLCVEWTLRASGYLYLTLPYVPILLPFHQSPQTTLRVKGRARHVFSLAMIHLPLLLSALNGHFQYPVTPPNHSLFLFFVVTYLHELHAHTHFIRMRGLRRSSILHASLLTAVQSSRKVTKLLCPRIILAVRIT